jgi:hypothetical protein
VSRQDRGARWTIEISREVERWYIRLNSRDRAFADRAFDLLAEHGPMLGMPHSKQLGGGLRELRFHCAGVARRVTYYLDPSKYVITLTTFRKQRANESREIVRARMAMQQHRNGK